MKTYEIEQCVARYYNPRVNLIVPNVSWGLFLHECDLLVCTKAGYLHEIEIKISLSDLKADKKKAHQHLSKKIKCLYFAIPENLEPHIEHIPERAGILLVRDKWRLTKIREAQRNPYAGAVDIGTRYRMAWLGCMRIWQWREQIEKIKEVDK